ncbi:tRNA preQ1(34) S-adenosylmethionine ribosyltransferase-isomerase QueA [Lentisphaerota bacterium WC36G]|nr:tRNA preQ1(34) S-adenosylmethionine ribosyltransferase-isomerase QueA [Lentisphaerae bacterium WC36]
MQTELFDYNLPEELIAQYPAEQRTNSRMLVMKKDTGECDFKHFNDIIEYLKPNDCIVFNDTKVMSARMYGRKNGTIDGALIEVLLLKIIDESSNRWQCMLRPGKRVKEGVKVRLVSADSKEFTTFNDYFEVVKHDKEEGVYEICFNNSDFEYIEETYGHIPLPPYIKREDEFSDKSRYQTMFAKESGAVAAPTAGLHFTPDIIEMLQNKGVKTANITLHVGPGTFKPVDVEDIQNHKMHTEEYVVSEETAKIVNDTKANDGRVFAIGTTSVRTLESCADKDGKLVAQRGSTNIFIYPPYQMKIVDSLLTNFHLPKSTLIMLVSALSDREKVMNAYHKAIENKMRFYSYGDCMLLI